MCRGLVILSCSLLSVVSVLGGGTQQVTCGSVVKLMNQNHKVRLHSHDVKYGSGSGQQSVTGTSQQEDVNSHWTVKGPEQQKYCKRGEPVECGQKIRLEHLTTNRNLHSHHFSSPLTSQQEVSAFGRQEKATLVMCGPSSALETSGKGMTQLCSNIRTLESSSEPVDRLLGGQLMVKWRLLVQLERMEQPSGKRRREFMSILRTSILGGPLPMTSCRL